MRLAVRVLLSALDPEDIERAFRWLDGTVALWAWIAEGLTLH